MVTVTQTWGKGHLKETFTAVFALPVGTLVELGKDMVGYGDGQTTFDYTNFHAKQVFTVIRYLAESNPMYIGWIIDKAESVGLYAFDRDELEQFGKVLRLGRYGAWRTTGLENQRMGNHGGSIPLPSANDNFE